MTRQAMLLPLVIAMLGSCKSNETTKPASTAQPPAAPATPETPSPETPMTKPAEHLAPTLDPAAIAATSKGLNAFTLALYDAVPKKGNTILSPFSVASALSLVELGAKGEAAAVLHNAFGASSAEQHRTGLQGLVHVLKGGGGPGTRHGEPIEPHVLRVRNSLWVAASYKINTSFVDAAKSYYQAIVRSLDVSAPQSSSDAINSWVSDATDAKIKDIIQPALIDEMTRMILVNAVHFVGRWREPFSERETADRSFYVDDKKVDVPTMVTGHFFRSLDNDDVTIAEMPYWSTSDDAELAMTLIVPKKLNGLRALESKLTDELLTKWLSALQAQVRVIVYLPKWKAETTAQLTEPLSAMGLDGLFSGADLSGISDEEGLHIGAVLHKTFISVDEKGTEAAAATAIMLAGSAPSKPLELHVDHPFLYLIRDTHSGTILFIGRVMDPR